MWEITSFSTASAVFAFSIICSNSVRSSGFTLLEFRRDEFGTVLPPKDRRYYNVLDW
jgi:hypothetical protein